LHRRIGLAHLGQHVLGGDAAVHQPDASGLAVLPFGVQSRIADIMESASAAASARPPLDRTKTILGSPMTAPSRVKLM
jgi:hypothetical protein